MPTPMQAAIMSSGAPAAYVDMWFAANTYRVAGVTSGDLPLVTGFTFTGASLRTMFDSTGKLTYGPNNLLLQSQTLDNAYWTGGNASVTADTTAAPDGTLTADTLTENSSVGVPHTVQRTGVAIGISVAGVLSVYAKNLTRRYINVRVNDNATNANAVSAVFDLQAGTITGAATAYGTFSAAAATITSVGNGWYRCSIGFLSSAATIGCKFELNNGSARTADGQSSYTGDGVSGAYLWGAQLEAVTYRTTPAAYMPTTSAAYYGPRLVYDPSTLASLGILVEEARTNVCLQSQDFSTTWTVGGTVTVNATTSPDGTSNADLITSTGSITVNQPVVLAATVCTYSVYAKKSTGATQANRFGIRNSTTATDLLFITFNYDTGGITYNTGASGATATNVGNGWWRIELTVSSGITSGNTVIPYVGFIGAATSGQAAYFWQAQLEAAVGASSAIVTTSAAVTRAADVAILTGLALGTEYSLAAQWQESFDDAAGFRRVASISSAALARESAIYHLHTTNTVRMFTTSDMDLTLGTGNALTTNKAAGRFVTNDSTGSLNGAATVAPDTGTATVSSADRVNIGSQFGGGGNYLEGTISRVRIYNRALSDAQLQSLTT